MSSIYDRSYIYGLGQAILQRRGPFFDALEVGGPGGESCLTMQTILFGGTAHGIVNAQLQKRYV